MTTTVPRRRVRDLLPFRRKRRGQTDAPAAFAVPATAIEVLHGPTAFRERLLAGIASARRRIVLVALYLQDDDGGREVLQALHDACAREPALAVEVYVDWHRARRGLIGGAASLGNTAMYQALAGRHGDRVAVYGVPVQTRELFGVLHLKGFVLDDAVIYSGASLNDVYLARHGRYRLDRYHVFDHAGLADSLAGFVQRTLRASPAVRRLDRPDDATARSLQPAIRDLRQVLAEAAYAVPSHAPCADEVAVIPLLGFGRADNALNDALLMTLDGARRRIALYTPYFNLPRPLRAALGRALRRGCQIEIVVGDKVANDFYIAPGQPFSRIGLLPYLYESNLRRFARLHRAHVARGQLNLRLWRHGDNTFHLKGINVDDGEAAIVTGNNLNPRAWALDLENGLLLRDPQRRLAAAHHAEWVSITRHTRRLEDFRTLPLPRDYPPQVRRLLRRLKRVRLDRLLNRLM